MQIVIICKLIIQQRLLSIQPWVPHHASPAVQDVSVPAQTKICVITAKMAFTSQMAPAIFAQQQFHIVNNALINKLVLPVHKMITALACITKLIQINNAKNVHPIAINAHIIQHLKRLNVIAMAAKTAITEIRTQVTDGPVLNAQAPSFQDATLLPLESHQRSLNAV